MTKCDLLDEELMEMLREEMQAPPSAPEAPPSAPEGATIVSKPGKETNEAPSGAVGGAFGSVPVVFISAVTGFHLDELKDVLWRELNSESNKLQPIMADDRLVHRDKDMASFAQELADEDADGDVDYLDEDEIEDLEDVEYLDEED